MALPLPTRTNGQVIDQTWFNLINTELVALDAKVTALKTGTSFEFVVTGEYATPGTKTQLIGPILLSQDITVTAALLRQDVAATTGLLEVDVEFKRGAGAWTTLFNITPIVDAADGNGSDSDTGAGSTAAVIDTVVEDLQAGDLLRLNTLQVPSVGLPDGFILKLDYTVTGT